MRHVWRYISCGNAQIIPLIFLNVLVSVGVMRMNEYM